LQKPEKCDTAKQPAAGSQQVQVRVETKEQEIVMFVKILFGLKNCVSSLNYNEDENFEMLQFSVNDALVTEQNYLDKLKECKKTNPSIPIFRFIMTIRDNKRFLQPLQENGPFNFQLTQYQITEGGKPKTVDRNSFEQAQFKMNIDKQDSFQSHNFRHTRPHVTCDPAYVDTGNDCGDLVNWSAVEIIISIGEDCVTTASVLSSAKYEVFFHDLQSYTTAEKFSAAV